MIWFLYEFLTAENLPIPDLENGIPFVPLLNSEKYFTATSTPSNRHKIDNNLLGIIDFCPMIRRTPELTEDIKKASQYAYCETPTPVSIYETEIHASAKIEEEQAGLQQVADIITALQEAPKIDALDEAQLGEWLRILKSGDTAPAYRTTHKYITDANNTLIYVAPKSEDIPALMKALLDAHKKHLQDQLHPIIAATLLGFGLALIQPFENGNWYLQRFLIHYSLARSGFTPPNTLLPISAIITEDLEHYHYVLGTFIHPCMASIQDVCSLEGSQLFITKDTKTAYSNPDFTAITHFVFECLAKSHEKKFKPLTTTDNPVDLIEPVVPPLIHMPLTPAAGSKASERDPNTYRYSTCPSL